MWKWTTFEALVLLVYLVLFTSAYMTQALKIIKSKSSENVDKTAFIRVSAGQLFFTIYAFSLKRIGFFLGSALTFLSVIVLSACILIYRKKGNY
jgi:uncharacterized protein with PQ loop repeat